MDNILIEKIKQLKKEKNAVILAHYYQNDEVQMIADYVGDSLALAQIASQNQADILVFCGVDFMAETAKILSYDKKVLLPNKNASCSMANMIDTIELMKYKSQNPDTVVVAYVNSRANIKALADVCVTSSNALKIIDFYQSKNKKILYCPDQNLAKYAMKLRGYNFDVWHGYCAIHNNIDLKRVKEIKAKYPNALFIAHPECKLDVLNLADYIGSTKQLIDFVNKSSSKEFIIATEIGVLYEMKKNNPEKKFIPLSEDLRCNDMKLIHLEDIYNCLLNESNEISIDIKIAQKAKKSLDKMLELS